MRTSYAVLWQEVVDTSCSGRLELGRDRLRLEGMRRPGGGPKATELLYEEITCVRIGRTAGERLDGRSSVVVETERGRALLMTSTTGLGMNREIEERLGTLVAAKPAT